MPKLLEINQPPRMAEVPCFELAETRRIGQNLVDIKAPPLIAEVRGRLGLIGLLPMIWPCPKRRCLLDIKSG